MRSSMRGVSEAPSSVGPRGAVKVAILGCGGIGSRHLQALRLLDSNVEIIAVDPSQEARQLAQQRWDQAPFGRGDHQLQFLETLDGLDSALDVAIVATGSDVRRSVTEHLFEVASPRHVVLEKFLFPRVEDYARVSQAARATGIHAWVNTSRRMWPDYARFRNDLNATGPVALQVTGVLEHGLGSNAVHFLDLLAFLTGRPIDRIDGALLEPRPNTKRPRFTEFVGSVSGSNDFGDHFHFTALDASLRPLLLTITSDAGHLVIDEAETTVPQRGCRSGVGGAAVDVRPVRPVRQSSLTSKLVMDLVNHGSCSLPTLEESTTVHVPLLKAFLASFRHHVDPEAHACPVT